MTKSYWLFHYFRNLESIKDREICCYSISCKEKDNIGKPIHKHCTLFNVWSDFGELYIFRLATTTSQAVYVLPTVLIYLFGAMIVTLPLGMEYMMLTLDISTAFVGLSVAMHYLLSRLSEPMWFLVWFYTCGCWMLHDVSFFCGFNW